MLHRTALGPLQKRFQPLILHMLRAPIMWVCLVVVLAIPTFILVTNRAVPANTPTPADLFMQLVVKRDAAMGWHQLCSSVQSQVPLPALAGQVEKQRIAEAGTKLLERGYLLVFEALQIPTNEGSPRIQQSKMMLSQR